VNDAPPAAVRASESSYDARTCCGATRAATSRTEDIVGDSSDVITSWGTIRTFLEVGT